MCAPFGYIAQPHKEYICSAYKSLKLYTANCLHGAPEATLRIAGQSDGIETTSIALFQQSRLALGAEHRALNLTAGVGGQ